MVSAGHRTIMVGDPGLAKEFVQVGSGAEAALSTLPGGADFTPETQALFDAVASQCAASGYRVVRIPTIPAKDGRTYFTYVNVIIDQHGGKRRVYMPVYHGVERLNAAAQAVWENLGCEVHRIDCTTAYPHFGSLHCLVNILRRDPS